MPDIDRDIAQGLVRDAYYADLARGQATPLDRIFYRATKVS